MALNTVSLQTQQKHFEERESASSSNNLKEEGTILNFNFY